MGKRKTKILDPEKLQSAERIIQDMKGKPEFSLARQHKAYHALKTEAVKYSVRIEFNRRERKEVLSKHMRNLHSAREYFGREYGGELTEKLIGQTAYLVEPAIIGEPEPYRIPGVLCFSTGGRVYPRGEKVPMLMERFVATNNSIGSCIERALHAHLHLTSIHPFPDGNGRLARLVQNGILESKHFPPIVIYPNEREKYIGLVSNADVNCEEEREDVN